GEARFRMLETIREYGHLRRGESGEGERIESTVEQWAVDTCEGLIDDILGPGQLQAVGRLRAEELNLTPTLRRLLDREDDRVVVMLSALLPFWMVSGEHIRVIEHFQILEDFLAGGRCRRTWPSTPAGSSPYRPRPGECFRGGMSFPRRHRCS